jgi:hypothetical protein
LEDPIAEKESFACRSSGKAIKVSKGKDKVPGRAKTHFEELRSEDLRIGDVVLEVEVNEQLLRESAFRNVDFQLLGSASIELIVIHSLDEDSVGIALYRFIQSDVAIGHRRTNAILWLLNLDSKPIDSERS